MPFGLKQAQKTNSGIEIFQVKKAYSDSSKKKNPECYYCLNLTRVDLFDKPLLTSKDIEEFDWTNQQIKLTEEAKRKIKTLEIPLQGLPVAMVLNEQIIYGFWFWNEFSSFGCDRVYTFPRLDFKIKFGLPQSNTFGNDPRFDKRLKKYIAGKK
jgi:hypothetical protein